MIKSFIKKVKYMNIKRQIQNQIQLFVEDLNLKEVTHDKKMKVDYHWVCAV